MGEHLLATGFFVCLFFSGLPPCAKLIAHQRFILSPQRDSAAPAVALHSSHNLSRVEDHLSTERLIAPHRFILSPQRDHVDQPQRGIALTTSPEQRIINAEKLFPQNFVCVCVVGCAKTTDNFHVELLSLKRNLLNSPGIFSAASPADSRGEKKGLKFVFEIAGARLRRRVGEQFLGN